MTTYVEERTNLRCPNCSGEDTPYLQRVNRYDENGVYRGALECPQCGYIEFD